MNQKAVVVAVHGVGQRAVGASAQALAVLLAGMNSHVPADSADQPSYSTFVGNALDVPLLDAKRFTPFRAEGKPCR
jgi:hypothetical protein